jgi:acyl transferase domain-containing protein/1-acyl-sn-glycerol-3-phosphate acyltransferase/NAD(P)-dependent dehydrogenase (short-subunit alcohol dehydrogenase family)/acyl carrier protein
MRNENGNGAIAIVGIGCRFPGGADNPHKFWELLKAGFDAITEIPASRSEFLELFDSDPRKPGRSYSRWGGFLKDVDLFDAQFFQISPREAVRIDPQHRLLLELVWEACEDGGLPPDQLAGSRTGVFVGISTHDYGDVQMYPQNRGQLDLYSNSGTATSIAANRISYIYDLRGPSFSVDTACSSALTALHLACQSLRNGDCDQAIVGGAQLVLRPELTIGFCKASMLSRDGRCKAFDASANGYVRSEGAGVVILKPLDAALAERSPIYAVIRATAINQDGHTNGMTFPSQSAQRIMLEEALAKAGIAPSDVQYVEAHGPGTPVGDPVEAAAIGAALSKGRAEDDFCAIGSVKTNIGHLEAASGMPGLIKVALALKHRQIPPSLHFHQANESIDFQALRLRVVTALESWPHPTRPAIAGLNSFGFGGANAHVLLEEPPPSPAREAGETEGRETEEARLLVISAKSQEALTALARSYTERLNEATGPPLGDLCRTAALGRTHHDFRASIVASRKEDFAESLSAFVAGENRANIASGQVPSAQPKVAFVYTGMGPQWWGMGRQLRAQEPVFRAALERCDAALSRHADWSLLEELSASEANSRAASPELAQVTNFAIQMALTELWASFGIVPDAVMGHSGGAMAAAYAAGVYDLDDAVRLSYHRSRLQGRPSNEGRMLAVGAPFAEVASLLNGAQDRVSLAAVNSPASTTLAGDGEVLEQIHAKLTERQIFARFLPVTIAYHSPAMDQIKEEFLASVPGLEGRSARIQFVSDTTGSCADGAECDVHYWWRAIRKPVLFAQAMEQLITLGARTFLEIGPHPVLSASMRECLEAQNIKGLVLPSLRRFENERPGMLRSLGALYCAGHAPNWTAVQDPKGRVVSLPTYPWQRERHWFESSRPAATPDVSQARPSDHPMLGWRVRSARPTWESSVGFGTTEFLKEHLVRGSIVCPGAAYVDLAIAARTAFDAPVQIQLSGVEFIKPLVVHKEAPTTVQLVLEPERGRFEIFSPGQGEGSWICHARGVAEGLKRHAEEILDIGSIKERIPFAVSPEDFYARMEERSLIYGPAFRGIQELWAANREAIGLVSVPGLETDNYQVHPALLDAAFQVLAAAADSDPVLVADRRLFLPVRIKKVRFYSKPGGRFFTTVRLTEVTDSTVTGDVRLMDESGRVSMDVIGLSVRRVEAGIEARHESINQWLYDYRWESKPIAAADPQDAPAAAISNFPVERIREDMQRRADALSVETGWGMYYERVEARLNELAAAYVAEAFSQLAPDSLTAETGWRRSLARELLQLLERADLGRASAKRTSRQLAAEILHDFPNHALDVQLLERCGPRLADVLAGKSDGREVLFSGDGVDFLERFYSEAPTSSFYNTVLAEVVSKLIAEQPNPATLRVLEVGAGTGGTSTLVLPQFDPERTGYVFTDVSPLFLERARARFAQYSFLSTKLFDVTRDPAEQGFKPASFDLIIGANVLHATPSLESSIGSLKELLAPGGVLVLLEITRRPYWLDIAFGLTEGWWKFADRHIRPDHPLITGAQWQQLLDRCSFENAAVVADSVVGEAGQSVILARKPIQDVSAAPAPHKQGRHWLIFADRHGAGEALAQVFEAKGQECTLVYSGGEFRKNGGNAWTLRPDSVEDMAALSAGLSSSIPKVDGVVHLWSLDIAQPTVADDGFAQAQALGCGSIAALLRGGVLASQAGQELVIVTAGAQTASDAHREPSVLQVPVWGFGRVLLKELLNLRCRMIDLNAEGWEREVDALAEEILLDDPSGAEEEIALRSGDRLVHRLRPTSLEAISDAAATTPATSDDFWRAEISQPGLPDSIVLRRSERVTPGPQEVEFSIQAAGLNFRDVVLSTALVAGLEIENSNGKRRLGSEFAGTVTRCGEAVTALRPGDEIFGISPAAFASHAVADARLVLRRPVELSVEQAAAVPLAYVTAWYGLLRLAKLSAGEKILIHSATGGVGFAAVQIAKLVGAEIFATAGDASKRSYLESLGVQHVMDSRTLEFADEILARTGGLGADVVLNSLHGEAMERGLAILAPYGRFIELGKADIYQGGRMDLSPFKRSISFCSVDLDRMSLERPGLVGDVFREVAAHLASGAIALPPVATFEFGKLREAIRTLAQAKHIGKLVMLNKGEMKIHRAAADNLPIRSDGTYLITGGLGGLGLECARWLVASGARALVLMSRSDPSLAADLVVAELRDRGATVQVLSGDVAKSRDVEDVLASVRANMPPLRGILHAAMALEDKPVEELDRESLDRVMAPKILGAWNLHRHTLEDPVELFVSFSSITAVLGNAQQASYAAANAFLDAFAFYRRAQGLPATTINWGVISGSGYVARHGDLGDYLGRQGYLSFSVPEVMEVLSELLKRDASAVMAARIDWRQFAETAPRAAASSRVRHLVPAEGESVKRSEGSLRALLESARPEARLQHIEQYLRQKLAALLGASPSTLQPERPLTNLGLDSLISAELTVILEKDLGVSVAGATLLGGADIRTLSAEMLRQMGFENAHASPAARDSASTPALPQEPDISSATAPPPAAPRATALATNLPPRHANGHVDHRALDYSRLDYSKWTFSQQLARSVFKVGFRFLADVEAEGLDRIPSAGPCLLAVNHLSMADVPLLFTLLQRRVILLAFDELRNSPILHWFVSDLGQAIYIKQNELDEKPLNDVLTVLSAGGLVALSPEGSRSKSGLLVGRTGVAYLATKIDVPIIPVAAWGQEKWRSRFHGVRRLPVQVRVGEPIRLPVGSTPPWLLREYTDRIMAGIASLLPSEYRGAYAETAAKP